MHTLDDVSDTRFSSDHCSISLLHLGFNPLQNGSINWSRSFHWDPVTRLKFLCSEIRAKLSHPFQSEGRETETVLAPVNVKNRLLENEVALWDA